MGYRRRDAVLKEFWRVNERFADLFNTVLFGGEEIICPAICRKWTRMFPELSK